MANAKRNTNESFSDYRLRLKNEQEEAKIRAKGKVVWNSQKKGTYIRKVHGEL